VGRRGYEITVSEQGTEELKRAQAAERKVAELQAYLDDNEKELDELRAKVAAHDADSARTITSLPPSKKELELQAYLEDNEKELDELRAKVAAMPPASSPSRAGPTKKELELQAYLDDNEKELDELRAKVAALPLASSPNRAGPTKKELELQAYLDDNEKELDELRAKVAAMPPASSASRAGPTKKELELQAYLDDNEKELDELRAKVAALPTAPVGPTKKELELQAYLDDNENELDELRTKVAGLEAEARLHQPHPSHREEELKAYLDDDEKELDELRAKVATLEVEAQVHQPHVSHREEELKAYLDDDEKELDELRAKAATLEAQAEKHAHLQGSASEAQQWLTASETENEKLRERLAELEHANLEMRQMTSRIADSARTSSARDLARLEQEVALARADGAVDRLTELEFSLSGAREAIANLEAARVAAVQQAQRYASRDGSLADDIARKSKAELDGVSREKDARIAVLQAGLEAREGELKKFEDRLKAWAGSEEALKRELETLRVQECEAREKLGRVTGERDTLSHEKVALANRLEIVTGKLDESTRWLADEQKETESLTQQLDAARLEHVLAAAEMAKLQPAAPLAALPPPPPEDSLIEENLGGFSALRLRRLELQLDAETLRADNLKRLVDLAEHSVVSLADQLELAQGRLADALKRLGLDDPELAQTLDRLGSSSRELTALRNELLSARAQQPPPPPIDALDDEAAPVEVDVVSGPLDAVGALAEAQAAATRQATDALQGEQRAREQLIGDLSWLKGELEKLSNVRDDLRGRIATMVQREVKRRGLIASLLETLRKNEVASAARMGTVRRLQAAIELAQRNAVKVQTVYFQKQIGSLNRQLEIALGKRAAQKPKPRAVSMVR
jgi:chromosome segregation ATPase